MARKSNQPRLKGLRCGMHFQTTIETHRSEGWGQGINTMITTYNTAVTDAASEILGKERRRKKSWATRDVLDLCHERRDLKKRCEAEGAKNTGKQTRGFRRQ